MILDETPSSVNARMKAVGGFADKNLVIWEKIKEAFPAKVESVRRVWSYDNEDVKANIPCVVQVNGAPIGAPMHFVVYVGNQKLYDPWGGVERATSYYQPQSYCVIKLKPIQPPMDDCQSKLTQITAERDRLNGIIAGKDKEIADLKAKDANFEAIVSEKNALAVQLDSEKKQTEIYKIEYDLSNAPTGYKVQIKELESQKEIWIEKEKTYNRQIGQYESDRLRIKSPIKQILLSIVDELKALTIQIGQLAKRG